MNNYVIVRADRAGVFFGKLAGKEGSEVTLEKVRKIYRWEGAAAVEQIAVDGLPSLSGNKLTVEVASMTVLGAIQILPCTDKAIESINNIPEWKA